MAKKKTSSTTTTNGQKYRKESKEERKARLKEQEEARQACFKMLPIAGAVVLASMIAFGVYVNSVPPHVPAQPVTKVSPDSFMDVNIPKASTGEPEAKPEEVKEEPPAEETIEL